MLSARKLTLLACALTMGSMVAVAQRPVWETRGAPGVLRFGSVFNGGDIDGDGSDELLVPFGTSSSPAYALSVAWISSTDGHLVLLRQYSQAALGNRWVVGLGAAGDFDNDGRKDWYRILYPNSDWSSTVQIVSTATNGVLYEIKGSPGETLSLPVEADIDLDGDGRPDLLVSSPNVYAQGQIYAYLHTNSSVPAYSIGPTSAGFAYTDAIAKVGKLDSDRCDDFVVTAVEPTGRGCGIVYSGKTGTVIRMVFGELPGDRADHSAAGIGDLDGDGTPDFALGGYLGIRGTVRAFSGVSGAVIRTWLHMVPNFGSNIVGEVDIDRDGVPDVLATVTYGKPGQSASIFGLSGRTGNVVFEHRLPLESNGFYSYDMLIVLRRPDGDSFPCFGYCDPTYLVGASQVGRLAVVRTGPPGGVFLGTGCTGRASRPLFGLSTTSNGKARMTATFGTGGDNCLLMLGSPATSWAGLPLPIGLDPFGVIGCSLWVPAEVTIPLVTKGGVGGLGRSELDLPAECGIFGPADKEIFAQWLCMSHASLSVTDGYRLRLREVP